METGEDFMNF